ncbi:MAG: Asp-tRNA(Asn)/Glu-tRNA(Gln) amidotransferase subunit GatC [Candidatus Omnitrophota bacterium]
MENLTKKNVVTEDVARYIAGLSRLSLQEKELSEFCSQLSEILGYIDKLNEVDTKNTLPTTHVLSAMKNVFREDVPKGSISTEDALKNAPSREKDLFTVPRVI